MMSKFSLNTLYKTMIVLYFNIKWVFALFEIPLFFRVFLYSSPFVLSLISHVYIRNYCYLLGWLLCNFFLKIWQINNNNVLSYILTARRQYLSLSMVCSPISQSYPFAFPRVFHLSPLVFFLFMNFLNDYLSFAEILLFVIDIKFYLKIILPRLFPPSIWPWHLL